jgi:LPXTG-site transpeptidase (sortase) family protein
LGQKFSEADIVSLAKKTVLQASATDSTATQSTDSSKTILPAAPNPKPTPKPNSPPSSTPPKVTNTPKSRSFYIEIPKISLSHPIKANVNPKNEKDYLPAIAKYVAHGKDTALPNQPNGNVYLFAHSKAVYTGATPNEGWFTRIDELHNNDKIHIYYKGQKYTYKVEKLFVVDPTYTDIYTSKSPFPNHKSLTLQTCYPRGDNSKRLIVLAKNLK